MSYEERIALSQAISTTQLGSEEKSERRIRRGLAQKCRQAKRVVAWARAHK